MSREREGPWLSSDEMAERLWRAFRSWPAWAQLLGWVVGFWVLVPVLVWRTTWHPAAKTVVTGFFLFWLAAVAAPAEETSQNEDVVEQADSVEEEAPAGDETPADVVEETSEPRPEARATKRAPGIPATVTRVVDGDTIEVTRRGRTLDVRLIGIDTPETVHPTQPVECMGGQASAFTKRKLEGERVRLEFDLERIDRYGRTLAYVWLGEELFNEQIVAHGFAQVSTYPPNVKYEHRFLRAQRQARNNDRGLWAPGACPEEEEQEKKASGGGNCDPNYEGTCVPIVDYDLDCDDISGSVRVVGEDKHGFDSDGDGYGCESN